MDVFKLPDELHGEIIARYCDLLIDCKMDNAEYIAAIGTDEEQRALAKYNRAVGRIRGAARMMRIVGITNEEIALCEDRIFWNKED